MNDRIIHDPLPFVFNTKSVSHTVIEEKICQYYELGVPSTSDQPPNYELVRTTRCKIIGEFGSIECSISVDRKVDGMFLVSVRPKEVRHYR